MEIGDAAVPPLIDGLCVNSRSLVTAKVPIGDVRLGSSGLSLCGIPRK